MKHLAALGSALILLFFYLAPGSPTIRDSYAQSAISNASGEAAEVKSSASKLIFPAGKVYLMMPNDLRAFTPEDFDKQYGSGYRPEYAFLHDETDTRIGISVTPTRLHPDSLEIYQLKMEKALGREVKDLMWQAREIVTIDSNRWIHLEMKNTSEDGERVVNDLYITSFGGHPLMVTMTTDAKNFYDMRKKIQKVMMSVRMIEAKQ